MEPDDLLCSRNARPQNDAKAQADSSSCSQCSRDEAAGPYTELCETPYE